MADPSIAVLFFLFSQVCGIVIPVPEEMVPNNLMIRDPDSDSGFSINHDVLNQLLSKLSSSSVLKRANMVDDKAEYKGHENEEEELQDDHEEYAEENTQHKYEQANNNLQQCTRQMTENKQSIFPHGTFRLEEQRTQEPTAVCEGVDSRMKTFSTPYPPNAPQAIYQRQNDQPSSNTFQNSRSEYQTVSEQYPFTEFSPKDYEQSKKVKASITNQYFMQDSRGGIRQRYEQPQYTKIRPSSQSIMLTSASSKRQPDQNVQYEQQEQAQREPTDYFQYEKQPSHAAEDHHYQPSQAPLQPPQRLQIGNVSVRRMSSL